MSFGNAAILACLPLALGLALLAVRRLRAQQRDPATRHIAKRWADHRGLADAPPALRDSARGVLLVAGVSLAVVALARPQWGEIEQQSFDPAREVLLALDLSRSMTADDVAPTRLDRAKLLVETLLDALQGERVGLVVFAGTSFLQSPLSADYEVMRDILEGLDPDYLPQGGTRYDLMLRASLEAYSQEADADRFLVVLSDGEAHTDAWRAQLPALRKKGIRVIGLGVGTASGSILSDASGSILKDERGAAVLSRLEADTLRSLADETDGLYRDAAGWVDIAALVEQTVAKGRRGAFVEERELLRQERFQWLLGPALLLLVLSAWLELPVAPSARSLRRAKAKRQPRPVFFETPGTTGVLVWLSAILLGVGAARVADATPGGSGPAPAPPPENPLVETIRDLVARPTIEAGDYAWLAEQTLDVAKQPDALAPEVRNGVIDDALAAVSTGEALDADAADWSELRRLLEALPRETPPPEDSEGGESSKDESGEDGESSESQQDSEGSESESDDASSESGSDSDSDSESSQSSADSDSSENDDPSSTQNSDASGSDSEEQQAGSPDELPELEDDSESGFGELDSEPESPPGEAPEPPPTPTRMVGGGNATPDVSEHPELADALGKMQNVRDSDSPSVLFERMNAGQNRPQAGGKSW